MVEMELQHAFETVNLWRSDSAAKIELNRPESLNAWDARLGEDLAAAIDAAGDDEIRAVLLTGAGRAFCSGADLTAIGSLETIDETGRPDLRRILHERYHPVLGALRALRKPVVSAVNGPCAGVGVSLALSADLVYARRSAYFLLAFVNVGLVPDGGASALVTSRVGAARAAEMAMLGERVDAARAEAWGLVNGVIDDDRFDERAAALLGRLAAGPTRAYAGIKRQLAAWAHDGLERQLDLEAEIQHEMGGTDDFAEGVLAFAQKRAASFTGR
ncbi:MAG: enoyl-CoA hydratase-related protein [Solirubrobacteraceae bacterium]|nr:enoyl-CoA hydratase-related protein [Solirubrobacteraceae bacterium]